MSFDDQGRAVERTQLAWQRTGLSHIALGGLSMRLLPTSPLRPVLAIVMIVLGAAVSMGARRMEPSEPHRRWVATLGVGTAASAIAAALLSFA